MTLIDRFVGFLSSNSIGKRRRATLEWYRLSDEERTKLGPELTGRGYAIPVRQDPEKRPAGRVIEEYTEAEKALLAQKVWEIRKNNPALSFAKLVMKAQDSLPKEKRRHLVSPLRYKWLVAMLKERDEQLLHAVVQQPATPQPKPPTREEIIASLTEAELKALTPQLVYLIELEEFLTHHPANQVLDTVPFPTVLAWLVAKVLDGWSDGQVRNTLMMQTIAGHLSSIASRQDGMKPKSESANALPRVMVIGLLPDQQNAVYRAMNSKAKLTFVDKNQTASIHTASQNVVVLMADFISHGIQNHIKSRISNGTQLVMHHGGISKLVERLEGMT